MAKIKTIEVEIVTHRKEREWRKLDIFFNAKEESFFIKRNQHHDLEHIFRFMPHKTHSTIGDLKTTIYKACTDYENFSCPAEVRRVIFVKFEGCITEARWRGESKLGSILKNVYASGNSPTTRMSIEWVSKYEVKRTGKNTILINEEYDPNNQYNNVWSNTEYVPGKGWLEFEYSDEMINFLSRTQEQMENMILEVAKRFFSTQTLLDAFSVGVLLNESNY